MPNYQNGKIYSIRSRSNLDLVYVGSTIQPLSVRFGGHKDCRNTSSSKQIIDIGDAYIELIENYSCNSKEELCKREGELIRSMDCVNKRIAGRKAKQYRIDNSDTIKDNAKQYYQVNADALKDKAKQYYQVNVDKANRRQKQYYQVNADTIKDRAKQKIKCKFCDKMIRKSDISRHNKSTNHIYNYINY